jgi:hypothetical protein
MDPLVTSAIAQTQAQTLNQIQSQASVSMLKKTVDLSAEQGAALVKMLDQSSGIGQKVDLYA